MSREIVRTAVFVSLLLAALAIHPYAPTIAVTFLAVWSLRGAKQAIQALSLLVVIKFLNPAIYHFEERFVLLCWLALAMAGVRVLVDSQRVRSNRYPVVPWLLLFSSVIFVQSLFFSLYSIISLLKIVSFTFMAVVVLVGFKITARQSVDWTPWFLGVWGAVAGLSAPTILFAGIGFATNGAGFQGILNQPQAFGAFLAPMVAWLTGTLLFSSLKRASWLLVATPAAWILLFFSASRTALIAVVGGFVAIVFVALWSRPGWRKSISGGLLRPASAIFALVILSVFLAKPSLLVDSVYAFVRKGDSQATITDSFETSRGQGIQQEWANFNKNPLFGIGFGVSSDRSFKPVIDPLTGLPLSAAIEKGFLPTAVLEEIGIFGATFFVVMLGSLVRHAVSKSTIALAWVFLASLFVNIGEMIFFSAAGLGLYVWLLMGWATCQRREGTGAS